MEFSPYLVLRVKQVMLGLCHPPISRISIGFFWPFVLFSLQFHLTVQILDNECHVQYSSLLRIFWILVRWILDHCLERLVWGFHVFRTFLSSFLSLLVRCCGGVCWFQNTCSNNNDVGSPLYFEQIRTDFCQRFVRNLMVLDGFCIVGMPHNLISYLLFQQSCLTDGLACDFVFSIPRLPWCRILRISRRSIKGTMVCCPLRRSPSSYGIIELWWWYCLRQGSCLRRCSGHPAEFWCRSFCTFVCHPLLFHWLVSAESFHWLGKKTSWNR